MNQDFDSPNRNFGCFTGYFPQKYLADVLASHSWIYSEVRISQPKMNLCTRRVNWTQACVSVAPGTATTTSTRVTSRSTDCWFMSCRSIIIIFTTNVDLGTTRTLFLQLLSISGHHFTVKCPWRCKQSFRSIFLLTDLHKVISIAK